MQGAALFEEEDLQLFQEDLKRKFRHSSMRGYDAVPDLNYWILAQDLHPGVHPVEIQIVKI